MKALITGSTGLVGSSCVRLCSEAGFTMFGIDNGARSEFFPGAPKRESDLPMDIRHRHVVNITMSDLKPDLIIHCAAQPSHDLAARIPFLDFETNAVGTLNLLEAARQHCPEAPFVFLSTNKVYGDAPNRLKLQETENRFDFAWHSGASEGLSERLPTDQCMHSLFGCSKLAADILVQEYGRYFGMPTVCLRAGCLTGPQHAGVELHGFLSHLVKCNVARKEYVVYGYKGKQVRDNLHADDVARFALEFFKAPKKGAVYNIGGGKANSCSILEAFELVERFSGIPMQWRYEETPRKGDHICYYTDLAKIIGDYPEWNVTRSLESIVEEMVAAEMKR